MRSLIVTVAALAAGLSLGWAGSTIFTSPQSVLDATQYTYATVSPGEVGSSISLNAAAAWTAVPVGSNLASGILTSTNIPQGQEAQPGTVLYTVNLRPTVIAEGAVPAFQSLSSGSSGQDVAQLQLMLSALGFYTDNVDGRFDWATREAVEAWQDSLGLDSDGVVQAGDIVFVPNLPARISLDTDKLTRGAVLSGGEDVVRVLPDSPAFTMPVTQAQAGLMAPGLRVVLSAPGGKTWEAKIGKQESTEDNAVTVTLDPASAQPICGVDCSSIPVDSQTILPARIITVESVQGLTVPSAALLTRADGSVVVIDQEGLEHPVSLLASAKGVSVIKGVTAGMMVRLPGDSNRD